MAVDIHVEIQTGDITKLVDKLNAMDPNRGSGWLKTAMTKALFKVEANAKLKQIRQSGFASATSATPGERLGVLPNKLTSRSGTLRRSINTDHTRLPGRGSVGTPLRYGAAHELGYTDTVQVRAHKRKNKKSRKSHKVRAHTRKMDLPARPFLKPALEAVSPGFPDLFRAEWESAGE